MVNKRAEVPIVVLVLGVLLVCGIVAAAGFLKSDNPGKISDATIIETCSSLIEQYSFYKNLGGYDLDRMKSLLIFQKESKEVIGWNGHLVNFVEYSEDKENLITSDGNLTCFYGSVLVKYPLNKLEETLPKSDEPTLLNSP